MDQERQHTPGGGSSATAVDYGKLGSAELTEIRFSSLTAWLDEGHLPTHVKTNIAAFIDEVADRAGFDWSSRDDDIPL